MNTLSQVLLLRRKKLSALSLAFSACFMFACDYEERPKSPEMAVKTWLNTLNEAKTDSEAPKKIYALLSSHSKKNLQEQAALAAKLQGIKLQPWEFLAVSMMHPKFAPKRIHAVESNAEGTYVSVLGEKEGEEASIRLSKEDGIYRIDLDLPSVPSASNRSKE